MMKSFGDRKFQLWYYTVSHGELLIRSPKTPDNPKNIDIMFIDVIYSELPRYLYNLKIEETKSEDIIYLQERLNGPTKLGEVTVLSSNGKRYFVAASLIKIDENELDMFELPEESVLQVTRNLKYF